MLVYVLFALKGCKYKISSFCKLGLIRWSEKLENDFCTLFGKTSIWVGILQLLAKQSTQHNVPIYLSEIGNAREFTRNSAFPSKLDDVKYSRINFSDIALIFVNWFPLPFLQEP